MTEPPVVTVTEDGNYLVRDLEPLTGVEYFERGCWPGGVSIADGVTPPFVIDVSADELISPQDARELAQALLSAADRVDGHRAHNLTQEDPCPSSTTSTGPTSTEHS